MARKRQKSEFPGAERCRRKFLRAFPGGFRDETYLDWERDYKWESHERWQQALAPDIFARLLGERRFEEIAAAALRVEQRSRHPMLFSFEKMALRDAVKPAAGARAFATGLFQFLHGKGAPAERFASWVETLASLPRRQTRVLTWPAATVFGFLAAPREHLFVKPRVTQVAAGKYGFDLRYRSRPSPEGYARFLAFAEAVRNDVADLKPRDMIDLQSFIWVQGSDEYA